MKQIRILHIVKDDKFFDLMVTRFESKPIYRNSYLLETRKKNYQFKYIKNYEKVELIWNNKLLKQRLSSGGFDIIFFHSIQPNFYKYFEYIDSSKIVIWWAWGFDLYSPIYGTPPFIPIELFKPLTKKLCFFWSDLLLDFLKRIIRKKMLKQREQWIKRVDYFNPVIHLEYELMKEVKGFRAKEYYYPRFLQASTEINNGECILLGNSAAPENNHLDVWREIVSCIPLGRTVIVPLSYGNPKYASLLSKKIKSDGLSVQFLRSFLPKEVYFQLLTKCSYAVFGALRQMSMGNIYYCLQRGVKVFLYRDSIIYKHLHKQGYVVFQIEEISHDSFVIPLSMDEIQNNKKKYEEELMTQSIIEQNFEKDIQEILHL